MKIKHLLVVFIVLSVSLLPIFFYVEPVKASLTYHTIGTYINFNNDTSEVINDIIILQYAYPTDGNGYIKYLLASVRADTPGDYYLTGGIYKDIGSQGSALEKQGETDELIYYCYNYFTWANFTFDPPIAITDSTIYYLAVWSNGSVWGNWGDENSERQLVESGFTYEDGLPIDLPNGGWYYNSTSHQLCIAGLYYTGGIYTPDAPTSFVCENATTYSNTQNNLSWTKGVNNVSTTYIERNATGVTSPWAIGTGTEIYNSTGTSYLDTGLNCNVHYYYQAWSYNSTDNLYSTTNASDDNTTYVCAESFSSAVYPISPYEQTSTPLDVNATYTGTPDQIALWYRWSDDNSSWDGGTGGFGNETVDNSCDEYSPSAVGSHDVFNDMLSKDGTMDVLTEGNNGTSGSHNNQSVVGNGDDYPPSDIGNETNFIYAQSHLPDSNCMNIQENQTGAGLGESFNDTADGNSDTQPPADNGTETNFENCQDISPDADVMTLWEENVGGGSGYEFLDTGDNDGTYNDWTETGTLASVDGGTIKIKSAGTHGWYEFTNTTKTGTLSVDAWIYCTQWDGDVTVDFEWTGDTTAEESIHYTGSLSTWVNIGTVPNLDTVSEVDDCRVRMVWSASKNDWIEIDAFYLNVSGTSANNYVLDQEYQFTGANFTQTHEDLCFYLTGSITENLVVDYWSGSWTNLGTISATAWSNFTATGLTSSSYNIRVHDATQTGDTTNTSWTIDCLFLHCWNDTDINYELEFEYNWTSVVYDKDNEYLKIYVYAHTGNDNLNVSCYYSSAWVHLGFITGTGYFNVSVHSYLDSSNFWIRLNTTADSSDTTQDDWDIDGIWLYENTTAVSNYGLDLEVNWTGISYNHQVEQLCIYTGTQDAEALEVDVYSAGSWYNLIADLSASSWNNVSITSYLTSDTFTIRFKGDVETGDSSESTWSIDFAKILYYNTSGGEHGIGWTFFSLNITDELENFSFTFPNSTGYYEFYSIANKTGYPNESAPGTKDAMCHYTAPSQGLVLSLNDCVPNSGVAGYTIFTFTVTWTDTDGDTPADPTAYLSLNISRSGWNTNVSMVWISGSNSTGAIYNYSTTLTVGSYTYHIWAYDGDGEYDDKTDTEPSVEALSQALTIQTASNGDYLRFNDWMISSPGGGASGTIEYNVSEDNQTAVTPALNITNTGNVPLNITLNLSGNPGSGITIKYNLSDNAPNPSENSIAITPSLTDIYTNLPVSSTLSVWIWIDFVNVLAQSSSIGIRVNSTVYNM